MKHSIVGLDELRTVLVDKMLPFKIELLTILIQAVAALKFALSCVP